MSDGMDQYTEQTTIGWGSRLGQSLKGVIFGLILFIAAFPLLWWNEGRAVRTARSLGEGAKQVIDVAAGRVEVANEGKLVHVTARAEAQGSASDALFGVSANAIKLRRVVEMYQWKESSSSRSEKNVGGSKTTTTTYSYSPVWSETAIDSGSFKRPEGHQNPPMPYHSADFNAPQVTLGAFKLSGEIVGKLSGDDPVDVSGAAVPEALRARARPIESGFAFGDASSPRMGDVRVTFRQLRPTEVSVVARQAGQSFEPYQTHAGGTILLTALGSQTAEAMFATAERGNTLLTWGLRLLGFVLMFAGMALIVNPLGTLGDVLPFAGSVVRFGTGLLSFVTALLLSVVIIALAWISYRPLVGLALLAGGCVATFAVVKMRCGHAVRR
jgi:hypothetical protein